MVQKVKRSWLATSLMFQFLFATMILTTAMVSYAFAAETSFTCTTQINVASGVETQAESDLDSAQAALDTADGRYDDAIADFAIKKAQTAPAPVMSQCDIDDVCNLLCGSCIGAYDRLWRTTAGFGANKYLDDVTGYARWDMDNGHTSIFGPGIPGPDSACEWRDVCDWCNCVAKAGYYDSCGCGHGSLANFCGADVDIDMGIIRIGQACDKLCCAEAILACFCDCGP